MQTVVILIHLLVVLGMIGVVLLQRSEGGGLGIGGGSGFLTSRGTANVLTRATAILAGTFFVTSLLLSFLAGVDRRPASILNNTPTTNQPADKKGKGVLDQLQGAQPPSGPQVPQSQ